MYCTPCPVTLRICAFFSFFQFDFFLKNVQGIFIYSKNSFGIEKIFYRWYEGCAVPWGGEKGASYIRSFFNIITPFCFDRRFAMKWYRKKIHSDCRSEFIEFKIFTMTFFRGIYFDSSSCVLSIKECPKKIFSSNNIYLRFSL